MKNKNFNDIIREREEFNNIDHYYYPSSIVLRYNKTKKELI